MYAFILKLQVLFINNHLHHVSKEDVKWLSYWGVEYYWFHSSINGFIIGFIITLLVSYVWKVCNETMLPFVGSIVLCSLFTRHFSSQYLKTIISIFSQCLILLLNWTVVNLKNQWWNQYWKGALLNKNYEIKCQNTRWCFTSTKIIYPKWCYLLYCWYWRQKIVLHYPLNYYLL